MAARFPFLSLLGLGMALSLCACAEKWEKPGGTPAQFDAMQSACISRASARFPPLIREIPINDGYTTPVTTNCTSGYHTVSCTQSGGQYVPPPVIALDDNQTARDNDVRACFYENGWQPAKDE